MVFDDLTEIYDSIIDWPKRLAHEQPFYRRLFDRIGVRNVLDAACGTGRHAALFHSWGLSVEGADVSPRMIQRARDAFGETSGLRWIVRGFEKSVETGSTFDATVCVGNSLALVPDDATAESAVQRMLSATRLGGVLVIHVLNLWHLPDGPCVWQKYKQATLSDGDCFIAKGVHRSGCRGFVNLLLVPLADVGATHTESVPFLGLETAELERVAIQNGATAVHFFGGYRDQPYDRLASTDLIMVAEK